MKVYAGIDVFRKIEFDVPENLISSFQHLSSDTASDEEWDAINSFYREEIKRSLLPNEELYEYDVINIE